MEPDTKAWYKYFFFSQDSHNLQHNAIHNNQDNMIAFTAMRRRVSRSNPSQVLEHTVIVKDRQRCLAAHSSHDCIHTIDHVFVTWQFRICGDTTLTSFQ